MEVLSSFCTVFISMLIILLLLICIYLYFFSGLRALRNIKPSCYISYDKNHFDKDFEFKCEFCGSIVSSRMQNVLSVRAISAKIKNIYQRDGL